ncbi:sugar O-acetyltransferase [Sodalis sp. C49]|uniref:sugar O-acetyltransferase n=1 Tax=Sodalis sp. C49 TaxID=3228929 RepID=UPI003965D271
MSELEKMRRGEHYFINDPELVEIRHAVRDNVDRYNALGHRETARQQQLLAEIFGQVGDDVHIEKNLRVDYGMNTRLGSHVFINFNFVLLDCAPVNIGNHVFIGPDVQLYTAHHPLDPGERGRHIGWAEPVTLSDNVWIAGGCIILPGVTIGENTTIGAGSVVTRPIPANVVACGNPCRVLRPLP